MVATNYGIVTPGYNGVIAPGHMIVVPRFDCVVVPRNNIVAPRYDFVVGPRYCIWFFGECSSVTLHVQWHVSESQTQ
jgi:hypothetical protein